MSMFSQGKPKCLCCGQPNTSGACMLLPDVARQNGRDVGYDCQENALYVLSLPSLYPASSMRVLHQEETRRHINQNCKPSDHSIQGNSQERFFASRQSPSLSHTLCRFFYSCMSALVIIARLSLSVSLLADNLTAWFSITLSKRLRT